MTHEQALALVASPEVAELKTKLETVLTDVTFETTDRLIVVRGWHAGGPMEYSVFFDASRASFDPTPEWMLDNLRSVVAQVVPKLGGA